MSVKPSRAYSKLSSQDSENLGKRLKNVSPITFSLLKLNTLNQLAEASIRLRLTSKSAVDDGNCVIHLVAVG